MRPAGSVVAQPHGGNGGIIQLSIWVNMRAEGGGAERHLMSIQVDDGRRGDALHPLEEELQREGEISTVIRRGILRISVLHGSSTGFFFGCPRWTPWACKL